MGSIYAARWKNAQRIGNKLKKYQEEGYLILNADGQKVGTVRIDDEGLFIDNGSYFLNEINLDNGYYDSVKTFNSWFKDWKIIHPKHIKRIR